jgi:hypothetical protein
MLTRGTYPLALQTNWAYVLGVTPSWEVDVEYVRRLLANGCPQVTAIKIVL